MARLPLHQQRREQRLDGVDVRREPDHRHHGQVLEPDAAHAVGGRHHLEQEGLGHCVRVVDRESPHHRGLPAGPAGPGQGVVDGVAGHELLGLRRQRLRLGLEARRLGLGQQGPDLGQDRVVNRRAVPDRDRMRPLRGTGEQGVDRPEPHDLANRLQKHGHDVDQGPTTRAEMDRQPVVGRGADHDAELSQLRRPSRRSGGAARRRPGVRRPHGRHQELGVASTETTGDVSAELGRLPTVLPDRDEATGKDAPGRRGERREPELLGAAHQRLGHGRHIVRSALGRRRRTRQHQADDLLTIPAHHRSSRRL
jgi:hypothetical protein